MNADSYLRLEGIRKTYGSVHAVTGVDLSVEREEFVTLLGASGSGKTTMLMAIAGFIHLDAGRIALAGQDITYASPSSRQIGVVFQSYALFPHMTVFENVAYPLRIRRTEAAEVTRRVGKLLEMVQLSHAAQRYPNQLSGGQQQRVALARAMVFGPRLLLLDEPLGALDKKLREQMQTEIKDLQRELRMTVVSVTHDQVEALSMSDRIAVMRDGKIEQVGTPDALYRRPNSRFVADFIGEASLLAATAVQSVQGQMVADLAGSQIRFTSESPVSPGAKMTIIVRPEAIAPAVETRAVKNRIEGIIERRVYLGDVMKYWVKIADGQTLLMKRPHVSGTVIHDVGERISLTWAAEDTRLV
jgi:spermidine/putrescine ABC transporter ATP-binding subunit